MEQLSADGVAFLSEGTRTYGRRNGVPAELVVRIKPPKVRKAFNLAE